MTRPSAWILLALCLAGCDRVPAARPAETPGGSGSSDARPAPALGITADLAACDLPRDLLGRLPALSLAPTQAVPFPAGSLTDPAPRPACQVQGTGHYADSTRSDFDSVLGWLAQAGWRPALRYQADGVDGSTTGLYRSGVICVVWGLWDGGDDTDPSYVPSDTLTIAAACAKAAPIDTTLPW